MKLRITYKYPVKNIDLKKFGKNYLYTEDDDKTIFLQFEGAAELNRLLGIIKQDQFSIAKLGATK